MDTLSTDEAAALLHLNVKRVQALAREGRLPGTRFGRKWLFRRDDLERLLGALSGEGADPSSRSREKQGPGEDPGTILEMSARNLLRAQITSLHLEGVMAEVKLRIGDQDLVSIITRSSAERMRLAVGDQVFAVIKSTEIMIARGAAGT